MRFRIGYQRCVLAVLVLLAAPVAFSASITKTITPAPAATLLQSGSGVLSSGILKVGTQVGEYIPAAGSESRALASITKGLAIPSKGIVSTLKSGLKLNPAQLLGGVALQALLDGVDWVMKDGAIMKKGTDAVPYKYQEDGNIYWLRGYDAAYNSPSDFCDSQKGTNNTVTLTISPDGMSANCKVVNRINDFEQNYALTRTGTTCPTGFSLSSTTGSCASTSTGNPQPLVDSDYAVLDNFVLGKDGVYQQSLANEVCKGSGNYDSCVSNMGAVPYVSGPPSVSSPVVTTTSVSKNADGTSVETTTRTKTDYALSYPSGSSSVEITPTTSASTTTVTKDAAGAATSTATTGSSTTTDSESAVVSGGTFDDTPFPAVTPFYTQKFPKGFQGVWDDRKAGLLNSPFITFLQGFVPTFSGTCPTFGLSFAIMQHANFGSFTFGSLCYIFDFIKAIMLVTAMFTCRALIFGG